LSKHKKNHFPTTSDKVTITLSPYATFKDSRLAEKNSKRTDRICKQRKEDLYKKLKKVVPDGKLLSSNERGSRAAMFLTIKLSHPHTHTGL